MAERDQPGSGLLDDDFDERFSTAVADISARRSEDDGRRAMWRAHHHPDQYERCVHRFGRHWCRRCLALYPVAFLFAALTVGGWSAWPASLDLWFIWLPCLPITFDFVAEQFGIVRYSARRQLLTTLLVAPALGRGIGHELDDSYSWELWGPVLVFCSIWFVAALEGNRRGRVGA